MVAKFSHVLMAFCLFNYFFIIEGSIIKANNVPRVGRSNEGPNPFEQGQMGYVIKTNKNIPRMGRRNYDSENRYDIPKFYTPEDAVYGDDPQGYNQELIESYYEKQMENMKR